MAGTGDYTTARAKQVARGQAARAAAKATAKATAKTAAKAAVKQSAASVAGQVIKGAARANPVAGAVLTGYTIGNALKNTRPAQAARTKIVDTAAKITGLDARQKRELSGR